MYKVYQQPCTIHMRIPKILWVVKASLDTIAS